MNAMTDHHCACSEPGWEDSLLPPELVNAPTLLRAEGLSKQYPGEGFAAVTGVDVAVVEGELLALLGPSGCGKTTTLRMIGGFETPDTGTITLRDRDITALPPEKRGIGFVFQDYALFPHLTVAENVRFGLRGMGTAAARKRVGEMLDLVNLAPYADRRPHQLSGGQQQRVALARTLAVAPPLILLDEPFSNLDAAMRTETRQEVRAMLKAAGCAAILVTHDQEEALALADRVAVMAEGRIRQVGTPDAVYKHPRCAFVASFLGRSNFVIGEASGNWAETSLGRLPLCRAAQGRVNLALRPEQIGLVADSATPHGVVVGREFRGHDQLYWVDAGDRRVLVLSGPEQALGIGTTVRFAISEPVAAVEDQQAAAE